MQPQKSILRGEIIARKKSLIEVNEFKDETMIHSDK